MNTAARILLGLIFLIMGLNGFFNFLPMPKTPLPQAEMDFMMALVKTGYMNPLISGTQFAVAILLLPNGFVPLALAFLAPVIVNIFAVHVFLAPWACRWRSSSPRWKFTWPGPTDRSTAPC